VLEHSSDNDFPVALYQLETVNTVGSITACLPRLNPFVYL